MVIQEMILNSEATEITLPYDAQILGVQAYDASRTISVFYASDYTRTSTAPQKTLQCASLRVGDHVPSWFKDRPYTAGIGRFFYVKEI